jgi:hypothetical protein
MEGSSTMTETYPSQPFEGYAEPGRHVTLRQRLAQVAMSFVELITPNDLGDVDEEEAV